MIIQCNGSTSYYQNVFSQGLDVTLEFQEDRGLIAVQGPEAAKVLQDLTNVDMTKLKFMTTAVGSVAGVDNCRITRCG